MDVEQQRLGTIRMTQQEDDGMRQIAHQSLSATVYKTLRDSLAAGELVPGQKLTGRVLSERLGVSQTPVREAMLQLVAERALSMNPNRSVTVPLLSRETFIELREMRVALEGLAARHAARTPTDVDDLERLHDKLIDAKRTGDYRSTLQLNRRLHFSIYELSGRPELVATIQSLWARTGPYLNFLYEKADSDEMDDHPHKALLQALRVGDQDMAEEAIRKDILEGGKVILDALPVEGS